MSYMLVPSALQILKSRPIPFSTKNPHQKKWNHMLVGDIFPQVLAFGNDNYVCIQINSNFIKLLYNNSYQFIVGMTYAT